MRQFKMLKEINKSEFYNCFATLIFDVCVVVSIFIHVSLGIHYLSALERKTTKYYVNGLYCVSIVLQLVYHA